MGVNQNRLLYSHHIERRYESKLDKSIGLTNTNVCNVYSRLVEVRIPNYN